MKLSRMFISTATIFCLLFSIGSCKKEKEEVPQPKVDSFYFGADMSAVNMTEDYGGIYKQNNIDIDPFQLFEEKGCNVVRVRLFHTPQNENGYTKLYAPGTRYGGELDVAKTIKRAKDLGMEVCLDFHYSDTWADPENQKIPKAWENQNLNDLKNSVYNYTKKVLVNLQKQNLTPEMVQIGNEIDSGLLLPTGREIENTAALLNRGIQAVRDFAQSSTIKPKIVIHYSDSKNAVSRMNELIKYGVTDFDIFGVSYYEKWAKINFAGLTSVIRFFKQRFKQDFMVLETAFQWTETSRGGYTRVQKRLNGYPSTKKGQYEYLKALTQSVIDGGGDGIFYWEPTWVNSTLKRGDDWELNSFFDFEGNVIPAINYMNEEYESK